MNHKSETFEKFKEFQSKVEKSTWQENQDIAI
jgi:hypothetical protein